MKHLFSLALLVISLSASAQTIMNIYQSNGTVLQIPLSDIDSITYTLNSPGNLATLSTLPVGNITATSAVSGGNITNGGTTQVTQRGVCWNTSSSPTTANSLTNDGGGTGNYTSTLGGLQTGSTYYVRAYAINSAGVAYGSQVQFVAGVGGGIYTNGPGVADIDGNVYPTIIMNNGQEWMAANLRTSTYANGNPIPNVTNDTAWTQMNGGAWCNYQNNSSYGNTYGKLYNWFAANTFLCPQGWHLPTTEEWIGLSEYLGGDEFAGGKLKATTLWDAPNTGATNESGFSGLPGGHRLYYVGEFFSLGYGGLWWSASEVGPDHAWLASLYSNIGAFFWQDSDNKRAGLCVRCLRD